MKNYTHVTISLGIGLFMMSLFNVFIKIGILYFALGFFFVILGMTNDWLDFKIYPEHERGFWSHSPFSPLLIFISFGFGWLFSLISEILGFYLMIVCHCIFISHFLLDMLNPSGVPILMSRVSTNKARYDDAGINAKFFFFGVMLIVGSFLLFSVSL